MEDSTKEGLPKNYSISNIGQELPHHISLSEDLESKNSEFDNENLGKGIRMVKNITKNAHARSKRR